MTSLQVFSVVVCVLGCMASAVNLMGALEDRSSQSEIANGFSRLLLTGAVIQEALRLVLILLFLYVNIDGIERNIQISWSDLTPASTAILLSEVLITVKSIVGWYVRTSLKRHLANGKQRRKGDTKGGETDA